MLLLIPNVQNRQIPRDRRLVVAWSWSRSSCLGLKERGARGVTADGHRVSFWG